MRILQLANTVSTVGGIERYVARLGQRMIAAGCATMVGEFLASSTEGGENPMPCPVMPARNQRELSEILHSWRPDAVLSHQAGDAGTLECAIDHGLPVVELVHTTLCPGGKLFRRDERVCDHPMGLMRCFKDWYVGPCGKYPSPLAAVTLLSTAKRRAAAIARCDAVLVATEWMRSHVIADGVPADRVLLCDIREGIPREAPARAPPRAGPVRLLYVGRLVVGKGVVHAIESLLDLPREYTLDVLGDGWQRPALEAIVAEHDLGSRVRFRGEQDQAAVERMSATADILVVPSVWPEPAGLVVPEARSRGLPVVAFRRGGLPEWTTTYGLSDVVLTDAPDGRGLARAILGLVNDGLPAAAPASTSRLHDVLAVLETVRGRRAMTSVA